MTMPRLMFINFIHLMHRILYVLTYYLMFNDLDVNACNSRIKQLLHSQNVNNDTDQKKNGTSLCDDYSALLRPVFYANLLTKNWQRS